MDNTLDIIRTSLRSCRPDWHSLAAEADVPVSTIEKIAYGVTRDPGYTTVAKLVHALDLKDKRGG